MVRNWPTEPLAVVLEIVGAFREAGDFYPGLLKHGSQDFLTCLFSNLMLSHSLIKCFLIKYIKHNSKCWAGKAGRLDGPGLGFRLMDKSRGLNCLVEGVGNFEKIASEF